MPRAVLCRGPRHQGTSFACITALQWQDAKTGPGNQHVKSLKSSVLRTEMLLIMKLVGRCLTVCCTPNPGPSMMLAFELGRHVHLQRS